MNTLHRPFRFVLWATLLLFSCISATQAVEPALSAKELVSALSTEAVTEPIGSSRSMQPRANPEAVTRVCDPILNQQLLEASGQRGEQLTRTLYVRNAPNIDLDIAFHRGEATLLPTGKTQLDRLAQALNSPSLRSMKFVLAGHTDSDGGVAYNDRLSCERALSARNYLRDHHNIDSSRLVPMGFGLQKPKDTENPRSEANRRVEIRRFVGLGNTHH